jgi:hypothetical protein
VASQGCELAVISRVGYNRVLKKQLHGAIEARVSLLRGLSFMRSNSLAALQKVAAYCQDEIFPAGSIITDPACPPNRIFFIMQGEAKLVGGVPPWAMMHHIASPKSQAGGCTTTQSQLSRRMAAGVDHSATRAGTHTWTAGNG